MSERRNGLFLGAAALLALGVYLSSRSASPPPKPTLGSTDLEAPTPPPAPVASAPASERAAMRLAPSAEPVSPSATPSEPALMMRLRAEGPQNPALALSLARAGNARFPGSADAAERAWFVVRALSDLGRSAEAQSEARSMVDTYKDTSWALDVERHMLVNPPTHPEERGAKEP
ncbi:MAG: hypothetical protein QM756_03470 [Polyangiaceae bacterium]